MLPSSWKKNAPTPSPADSHHSIQFLSFHKFNVTIKHIT